MVESVEAKIEKFKSRLMDKEKSEQDIVREFLCFGTPYVFEECPERYFRLKTEVAKFFSIHPNEVFVIGSAKLGFSIAPHKMWKHFSIDSDIDIAVISPKAFDCYWEQLREFDVEVYPRDVKTNEYYQEFLLYFFKGWIRPDKFNFRYKGRKGWIKYFNSLKSIVSDNGEYEIRAGIFKDINAFEKYHCKNIKRIRNSVIGESYDRLCRAT